MTSDFSNRLKDAEELVNRNSVKKYIINGKAERWVVVGNTKEYLNMIDPYWCSCYDFQHSGMNDQVPKCKHNLAVQFAIKEDKFDTIHLSKEEYQYIRSDFLLT